MELSFLTLCHSVKFLLEKCITRLLPAERDTEKAEWESLKAEQQGNIQYRSKENGNQNIPPPGFAEYLGGGDWFHETKGKLCCSPKTVG